RVPAGYAAFVAPDERLATFKLVDVELQCLRHRGILHEKPNVIFEIVKFGNQRMIRVVDTLRREVSDDVIVPQYILERARAANVVVRRVTANGWRFDPRRSRPIDSGASRRARTTDKISRLGESVPAPSLLLL